MPPPPVTPSPHRFVVKKPAPTRRTPLAQEATPRASQQFKATPRFTISSTPHPTPSQSLPAPTPSAPRFATPARREDDIVISSSFEAIPIHDALENENGELGLDRQSDDDDDNDDEYDIEDNRTSKRRRLSPSPDHNGHQVNENEHLSSSLPILSSPPTTRRPLSTAASRFLSTPVPASTASSAKDVPNQPFLKPPRFRPPDPSEQKHVDPLPEQFSPHRKGQKYLPGGLASEVRDWLVDLEGSGSGSARREGVWLVRVRVEEVRGGGRAGMVLVKGRRVCDYDGDGAVDNGGSVRVVLAGEGAGVGLQRGGVVEIGKMVGIKGPLWEVLLEGEKWGVGVEWKVLGDAADE